MLALPAERAGVTAVICESELTTNEVAAVPPKVTAVAPLKSDPLITTVVPPAVLPVRGVTDEITAWR